MDKSSTPAFAPSTLQTACDAATESPAWKQVVLIDINMPVWTGQKVLSSQDETRLGYGTLSRERKGVLAPGSKKLVDPAVLKPFLAIRYSMQNKLEQLGIATGHGYAIPLSRSGEALRIVDEAIKAYEGQTAKFLAGYDRSVEDWINRNPDLAEVIRSDRLSAAAVAERFKASYATFRFSPLRPEDEAQCSSSMECLKDTLINDIARKSQALLRRFLASSVEQKIDRRCLSTFAAHRDRLTGLSFLSAGFVPLVEMLNRVLDRVPPQGSVTGESFKELFAVAGILANREVLNGFVEGTIGFDDQYAKTNGVKRVCDDLFENVDEAAPVSQTQPTTQHAAEPMRPEDVEYDALVAALAEVDAADAARGAWFSEAPDLIPEVAAVPSPSEPAPRLPDWAADIPLCEPVQAPAKPRERLYEEIPLFA